MRTLVIKINVILLTC